MKKILLPIDHSEISKNSFNIAKEFAENLGSKLVIVQVLELFESVGHERALLPDDEFFEKESIKILENAKSFFDGSDIEVETKLLKGSAANEIIDYAEKENFDLIIMNTHGMTASTRFLMGSVTTKVVKYAKVPVMVVR